MDQNAVLAELTGLLEVLRRGASERLITIAQVGERVGLSKSAIEQFVARKAFPAPRRVGTRSIAWLESEVTEWIRNLPPVSYVETGRHGSQVDRPVG